MDNALLTLSLAGALVLLVLALRRNLKAAAFGLVVWLLVTVGLSAARLVRSPWETTPIPKGPSETLLLALYAALLVGMLAQYFFDRFQRPPGRRSRFSLTRLLAPIFASPIVFIPLAATFDRADPQNVPRLMLLLVAFENGFFWRHFLETRRQAMPDAGS